MYWRETITNFIALSRVQNSRKHTHFITCIIFMVRKKKLGMIVLARFLI